MVTKSIAQLGRVGLDGQFFAFDNFFPKLLRFLFLGYYLKLKASSHILSAFELACSSLSYLKSMMKMCS